MTPSLVRYVNQMYRFGCRLPAISGVVQKVPFLGNTGAGIPAQERARSDFAVVV